VEEVAGEESRASAVASSRRDRSKSATARSARVSEKRVDVERVAPGVDGGGEVARLAVERPSAIQVRA
jgi:hypothetical protein